MKIIRDGKILRGMNKAKHLKYPVNRPHHYVDEEGKPRKFVYKGKEYRIEYTSGCFYPYVVSD